MRCSGIGLWTPRNPSSAVKDAGSAVYQLALTDCRNNQSGQHDLDEVLQERDKIMDCCSRVSPVPLPPVGLEVERFEMKDVKLPEAMQQVMAMQAEAIHEKAGAHHQGGSGVGSVPETVAGGLADDRKPGGAGIAALPNDRGSLERKTTAPRC